MADSPLSPKITLRASAAPAFRLENGFLGHIKYPHHHRNPKAASSALDLRRFANLGSQARDGIGVCRLKRGAFVGQPHHFRGHRDWRSRWAQQQGVFRPIRMLSTSARQRIAPSRAAALNSQQERVPLAPATREATSLNLARIRPDRRDISCPFRAPLYAIPSI